MRVLRLKKQVLKEQFGRIREGVIISTRNEDTVLLNKYGREKVLKIAQLHHDHSFDKKLVRDFKKNYENIDVFTLLTPQLQQEVAEIMKHNRRTKCMTMPNFLPETTRTEAVLENQAVAVGRLHPEKGFLRLIRWWKPVYEKTGAVLKIIGGGDQHGELEAEIRQLSLEKAVALTGPMDHDKVLEEMGKSAFYAMTSLNEGFGFVIIEAMGQGTPVIACDVRVGPRAILCDDKNGFLIPDGDGEAFAQRAISLLTNPEKRAEMSRAAVERAADFTEEIVMQKWEEILALRP